MRVFEFIKQVSTENEDLKEELEDMDIAIQMVITDADYKFWLTVKEGDLDFGDGEVENPSFTMSSNLEVGAGIMMGEVDATSAYMAGDITVEGNLQDAMAFQEIIELALEAYEDLVEDL
ncbi:MAG: SCP2 sterol-binding domain-containing protein [Promethearchaeota archaeon]